MSAPPTPAPVFTEQQARHVGPIRRFFIERPRVADAVLITCFAAWALVNGLGADSMYLLHRVLGGEQVLLMQLASVALTLAGAAALLWRRRHPVAVAGVMAALAVLALALTGSAAGFDLGLAFALYAVAVARRPRVTWVTSAVSVSLILVAARLLPLPTVVGALMSGLTPEAAAGLEGGFLRGGAGLQVALPVLVAGLLAVALGISARNRSLHLARFVEAANAVAREQEQREQLARASERTRIAREMHDVVAHSISVMVALSGGASVSMERSPEQAKKALDEVVATGRTAIGDMRRVLGVLHEGDEAEAGESTASAPTAPLPGSADLAALVERFRVAGMKLRAEGLDLPRLHDADPARQLAVYRVVQEALTNALRHAPASPAVTLSVRELTPADGPVSLEVVIADQGAASAVEPVESSQRGLIGMRERVAAFGGTVEARPDGEGWRVRAVLPWQEAL